MKYSFQITLCYRLTRRLQPNKQVDDVSESSDRLYIYSSSFDPPELKIDGFCLFPFPFRSTTCVSHFDNNMRIYYDV